MNLDRICTLLASGLKPSHVASIVGCTPARLSQLAKESTEFQNLLALKEAEAEKDDIEEKALSAKYHAAEHQLLDQVLAMAPVSELRDVTAALRVVAERQEKMKVRQNPIQGQQAVVQQIVQINIPAHALPTVSMTKEREITAIDETSLAPLTSDAVTKLFTNMKEKSNEPTRILASPKEDAGEIIEALSAQSTAFLDSREDYVATA